MSYPHKECPTHQGGIVDKRCSIIVSKQYKARLVIKGYEQRFRIDYLDIFSLVVKNAMIRLVLEMVASKNLHLIQIDAMTTFLHGDLEKENTCQAERITVQTKNNLVCRLKRSWYNLKQVLSQRSKNLKISLVI